MREELRLARTELATAKSEADKARAHNAQLLALRQKQAEQLEVKEAVAKHVEEGRSAPASDEVVELRAQLHELHQRFKQKEEECASPPRARATQRDSLRPSSPRQHLERRTQAQRLRVAVLSFFQS